MSDTIRQGVIAGILGTVGDAAIHWTAFIILGTTTTSHYISQLVFPMKDPTAIRLLVAEVVHFGAGAFVGVLLAMVYKFFRSDYPFYKGIGLGVIMWIVHVGIIPNLVAPRPYLFRTELETLIDLISHIVYGTIATIYWVKMTTRVTR